MVASPDVPEVANWILSLAVGAGTGIGAAVAYLRKPKEPAPGKEVAIVSASLFSDKQQIQDLMAALRGVQRTLEQTNHFLEADAHRREIEAEVLQRLKEMGIKAS